MTLTLPPPTSRSRTSATRSVDRWRDVVEACRPHQWAKNGLVFAVPFLAGHAFVLGSMIRALGAFVAFSAAASSTYLRNDRRDAAADRLHPTKRRRPLASGRVSPAAADRLSAGLGVAALAVAGVLGWPTLLVLAAYLVITATYNAHLKQVPGVELVTVASGFVLRSLAGATASHLPVSPWFLVVTAGSALLLVVGKRAGELAKLGDEAVAHRPVLAAYRSGRCTTLIDAAAGVAAVAYLGWATVGHAAVASPAAGPWLLASAAPFLIGLARARRCLRAGDGGDPQHLVLADPILLACGLGCAAALIIGLYLP